jgi:hypothetical protein
LELKYFRNGCDQFEVDRVVPGTIQMKAAIQLFLSDVRQNISNSRSLARLGGWLESRALGGERGASKLKARGGFSEGIVECWWRWAATWLVAEPVFSLEVQIATPA